MKLNLWTTALAAAGVVSLGSVAQAEEAQNQVMTALSSTTLSGYVSTSAIWKFGTGNALMPGRVFDGTAKQDGFNLDVVKLTVEKPLDEGEWSAGYKVDLLFGPDASFYNPGLGVGSSDVGIKQAYVNVRVPVGNGIDVKMGAFDTCIGYEVFDTPANPNYSRSYAYGIEPFAHTGVMASYKVNDVLSVAAGVANTYSTGINTRPIGASESEKTYMGLVTLTAPESAGFLAGGSLYAGVVDGINNSWPASDTTHYYVGGTLPTPIEGLSVGAAYDYRGTKEVGSPGTFGFVNSTYANAIAGYVSFQATEKLKLNGRFEYATGTAGTWYASAKADPGNELMGVTATADYALWENVLSRLEFRWDHSDEKVFGGNASADADKNALSLALNLVYKF